MTEFYSPTWNEKVGICWPCASDASISIRTKLVDGDKEAIKRMISGLQIRLKAAEEIEKDKSAFKPIEIVPIQE